MQGQFTGHFHPLQKITDHLGGITEYKYYPFNSLNSGWDNMYSFDNFPASSGYNYNMGIPVAYRVTPMIKEKILYNSANDSITAKVWQYVYDPCKSIVRKTPILHNVTFSKFTKEKTDSDFGFKKTTVKYPKLNVNETKVPYDVYTHYTSENDNLLFGKLNKVENFNASGQLLKKHVYEYRADTAYFNWFNGRRPFQYINSILASYVPSDYLYNSASTKPDLSIAGGEANMHFAETKYNNLFKDDSCGVKHYLNSYFVKLVKETSTSYDHSIKTKKKPYITGTQVELMPVGIGVTGRIIANNANMEPLISTGYGTKKAPTVATTSLNAVLVTDSIQNTTEYNYWDANPYGKTTCNGFRLLKEIDTMTYSNQLKFEPSWQLYTKKSYSPQHPYAYTTDEYFYYYDLIQNVDNAPGYLSSIVPETYDYIQRPDSFDALYLSQHYRIRNIAYQKRNLLKNAHKAAVINSEYYWYDAAAKREDCGFPIKTITINKKPCSYWGNGLTDSTQVDTVINGPNCGSPATGCYSVSISPWNGREIIAPEDTSGTGGNDELPWTEHYTICDGNLILWMCPPVVNENPYEKEIQYCTERYKLKLKNVYRQCDTLLTNTDTLVYRVTGTNPITFPYINNYSWTGKFKAENIARFKYYQFKDTTQPAGHKYQFNHVFSLPYKVYAPVTNFDFNELGLLKKTEDHRGLIKEMTYDQGYAVLIKNDSCPAWTWLTFNSLPHKYGQPNKIKIYDKNDPGNGFEYDYLFNPDLSVDTVTENYNRYTSYQYDYFGRLKTSKVNGDTISLTRYNYWNGDTTKTFEQRAGENYVETTLFNNKYSPVVETSRAYVDPLGRKFDVAVYADPDYYNASVNDTIMIHSGTTAYDNWDRTLKQYKPFIYRNTTPNTNVSFSPRFSNTSGPVSEQRYENNQRGNVLRATKFGEDINTGKKVLSTYNIINGWDLSQELNNTALLIDITSTNQPNIWAQYRFLKTAVMDEDGKKTVTYTDALGKKVAVKTYADAFNSQLTSYVYGSHFKPVKIKNPNGQNTTYQYDYNGNLELTTSVDADTVTYESRAWGDVIKAQNAAQKNSMPYKFYTSYRYDAFGKVILETVRRVGTNILNDAISNYVAGGDPLVLASYVTTGPITFPPKTTTYFNKPWNWLANTNGRLCMQLRSDSANDTPYNGIFYSYNNKNQLEREVTFTLLRPAYPTTEMFSVIRYTKYNLRNSLLEKQIDADGDSLPEKTINYEYDGYNRLTAVKVNNSTVATYSYYDDQGLVKKITHKGNIAGSNVMLDTIVHYYDTRNRLININSKLYKESLYYDGNHPQITSNTADTAFLVSASANFNGNINAIKHIILNPTNNVPQSIMDSATIYGYNYDGINRLVKADASIKKLLSNPSAYNAARQVGDESYTYDNIGNMTNIKRGLYFSTPQSNYTTLTNYSYASGKNQLLKIDSAGLSKHNYQYNKSGSQKYMWDSLKKEMHQTWYRNSLAQLPDHEITKKAVYITAGHSSYWDTNYVYLNYLYNARNERIGKFTYESPGVMLSPEGTYYLRSSGGNDETNVNVTFAGLTPWTYNIYGKDLICIQDTSSSSYFVRDHLGSVRLKYNKDSTQANFLGLHEAYDYTPFGTLLRQYQNSTSNVKYGYIGKEKDVSTKLNYFGARMYNGDIARWGVVDPLKDKYPDMSPYNYGANNPIFYLDFDGRDIVPHPDFVGTKEYYVWVGMRENTILNKYVEKYRNNNHAADYLLERMIAPEDRDFGRTYPNQSAFGKTFKAATGYNQDRGNNDLCISMIVIHEAIHASFFFKPNDGGSEHDHHLKLTALRKDIISGGKEFAKKMNIDVSGLTAEDWEAMSWIGLEATPQFQKAFGITLNEYGEIVPKYKDKDGKFYGSKKHAEYEKRIERLTKDSKYNIQKNKLEELKTQKID
jgi:RHS repeat-associated protein